MLDTGALSKGSTSSLAGQVLRYPTLSCSGKENTLTVGCEGQPWPTVPCRPLA